MSSIKTTAAMAGCTHHKTFLSGSALSLIELQLRTTTLNLQQPFFPPQSAAVTC